MDLLVLVELILTFIEMCREKSSRSKVLAKCRNCGRMEQFLFRMFLRRQGHFSNDDINWAVEQFAQYSADLTDEDAEFVMDFVEERAEAAGKTLAPESVSNPGEEFSVDLRPLA